MADWKMYPDEVSKLIHLYGQYECLWNCHNEEYKRTDLKRNAWEQLSMHFGKSINDIKSKIKSLRTAYLHEKKKVDASKKNARQGNSIYRPRLFYYTDFDYLDPVIILRQTAIRKPDQRSYIEQVDERDQQEVSPSPENEASDEIENFLIEEENMQPESTAATFQSPPIAKASTSLRIERKPKRKRHANATALKFEEVIDPFEYSSSKTATEESIYSAFGRTISLQLSLLTPLEATSTMASIHQLLSKKIMRSMLKTLKSRSRSSSQDSDTLNDTHYTSKRPRNQKYED